MDVGLHLSFYVEAFNTACFRFCLYHFKLDGSTLEVTQGIQDAQFEKTSCWWINSCEVKFDEEYYS